MLRRRRGGVGASVGAGGAASWRWGAVALAALGRRGGAGVAVGRRSSGGNGAALGRRRRASAPERRRGGAGRGAGCGALLFLCPSARAAAPASPSAYIEARPKRAHAPEKRRFAVTRQRRVRLFSAFPARGRAGARRSRGGGAEARPSRVDAPAPSQADSPCVPAALPNATQPLPDVHAGPSEHVRATAQTKVCQQDHRCDNMNRPLASLSCKALSQIETSTKRLINRGGHMAQETTKGVQGLQWHNGRRGVPITMS